MKLLSDEMRRAGAGALRLAELASTVVDCQTSGAKPPEGEIVELAWQRCRGGIPDGPIGQSLASLSETEQLPSRVSRLTGIEDEALASAPGAEAVWSRFIRDAASARLPEGGEIFVAHFAVFEARFILDWYRRFAPEKPAPIFLCTYEIARRLFPVLPKHSLRALSGRFGCPLSVERRAGPHVEATVSVWQRLLDALPAGGVDTLGELADFLIKKPEKGSRIGVFEMPRSLAEGVPDTPGVYRFLDARGDPLYVGKARRLKTRVRSYFQDARRKPGHIREMIGQIADAELCPLPSALEAAMLEAADIKRLRPPYNRVLNGAKRPTVYFSADYGAWTDRGADGFFLGPYTRHEVIDDLLRLSRIATGEDGAPLLSEAFGELTIEGIREGLGLWTKILERPVPSTPTEWIAVGLVLDTLGAHRRGEGEADGTVAVDRIADSPTVNPAFRRIVGAAMRGGREWKRGRMIRSLARCAVTFVPRNVGSARRRTIVFEEGRAIAAARCDSLSETAAFLAASGFASTAAPVSFGNDSSLHVNREVYDLISILLGELRRLIRSGRPVTIHWPQGACRSDRALSLLLEAGSGSL